MSERQQILEMLASGKITVAEAERLMDAIGHDAGAQSSVATTIAPAPKSKARFLRVLVTDGSDNVDVRVPLQLLRAGIKLASLIPKDVQGKVDASLQEKGINMNLSDLKPETMEELIDALSEMSINVADGSDGEKVRIFCE